MNGPCLIFNSLEFLNHWSITDKQDSESEQWNVTEWYLDAPGAALRARNEANEVHTLRSSDFTEALWGQPERNIHTAFSHSRCWSHFCGMREWVKDSAEILWMLKAWPGYFLSFESLQGGWRGLSVRVSFTKAFSSEVSCVQHLPNLNCIHVKEEKRL